MRAAARLQILACWLAAACRGAPAPSAHAGHEVSGTVIPNPKSSVSALVRVIARDAERAWVEHGDTPSYGMRTPDRTVSEDGTVTIALIGLTPDAVSHVKLHARWPDGTVRETSDLTVTTPPMPAAVPAAARIRVQGEPVQGYLLVGQQNPKSDDYVATLLDREGKVRWYWVAPTPAKPAAHFDRVRGAFAVVDGRADTLYELDVSGETRNAWRFGPGREGLDGHDFQFLPNGNVLLIGWEHRVFDTRGVFPGGVRASIRVDHTVDEMDARGDIVFHWSTFGHIGLDEIIQRRDFDPANFETDHTNSVEPLPDDAVLISARATSSVMKISRKDGSILWRLGGKRSDFRFISDPMGGFSRQHDVRLLPSGEIMLFDNGNDHTPPASRVVCYRLDPSSKTATMTWEYRHDPDVFSDIAGSARRLPNGHTVVGYSVGLITEVDAQKKVVWEARTPFFLYRAVPTPTLYGAPGGT